MLASSGDEFKENEHIERMSVARGRQVIRERERERQRRERREERERASF